MLDIHELYEEIGYENLSDSQNIINTMDDGTFEVVLGRLAGHVSTRTLDFSHFVKVQPYLLK